MDKEMIKRFGCSAIIGSNDFRKIADACAFDESGGVVQFENALMTEFASNPQCKSIEISYVSGPDIDPKSKASKMLNDNHYSFSLDYTPGELKQRWKMTGPKNLNSYTEGEGNVLQIASKTCSIVNNSGAKVVN